MIFDKIKRTDDSPKQNGEPYFEFYNRSSRPEIERVRCLIEDFFTKYPKEETDEFIARVRSGNDANFKSSTFELLLHEALLRIGCDLQAHPELSNGSNSKPDFLVKTSSGSEFYLEAVLASENNENDPGGEARKGVVYDALSSSPHQNFILDIEDQGYPSTQPSSRKLKAEIHGWLDSLDPDLILQQMKSGEFESITPFAWKHEGWEIIFRPIALKPEKRGQSKSLIGISGAIMGQIIDAWTPIKNAVKFKGSKYGVLEKPLLIAINYNSFHLDPIDEMQALYGQEQFIFNSGETEKCPKFSRAPNGAWHGEKGPQYTRVSGAWIFNDLNPTSISTRRQTIYFNPWATLKLPEPLKCFSHAIVDDKKIQRNNGISFAELYGLNEGWPEK